MLLNQCSDENLFERVRNGENDAFRTLYARYEKKLFAFIYRYLGNQQASEEVFQEAFLSVLKDNNVSFEQGSFRGWIYCVSRNLCLNRLRSENREKKAKNLYLVSREPVEEEEEFCKASLNGAVEKLPIALYEVYSLRISGLSYDEMAQTLRVPLGTVKSRMHEMVKFLRKEIESCNVN